MQSKIVEQRILTADDGKVLTNGETYGKTVVLPADADHTVWQEIDETDIPKDPDIIEEVEENG